MRKSLFQRIAVGYRTTALITFNGFFLFVLINGVLWLGDQFRRPTVDVVKKYGEESLAEAYPHLNRKELRQLLQETWTRQYVFEPFCQFREAAYTGRFVNVDAHGFRHNGNPLTWPPSAVDFNIFVFGGSTTFGYGVADWETVPSLLAERLQATIRNRKVNVFNFGRGNYYSTQERVLFGQLLSAGHRPDLAVFIDGLNDFYYDDDAPHFSKELAALLDGGPGRAHGLGILGQLPAIRKGEKLVRLINQRLVDSRSDANQKEALQRQVAASVAERVCSRFIQHVRLTEAMAERYEVKVAFVWQPVPAYKYQAVYHRFSRKEDDFWMERTRQGYQRMASFVETNAFATNFVWCADLQESLNEPLYVDNVHYSPKLCALLASDIAQKLVQRKVVP